jgi:hypothetical protein
MAIYFCRGNGWSTKQDHQIKRDVFTVLGCRQITHCRYILNMTASVHSIGTKMEGKS